MKTVLIVLSIIFTTTTGLAQEFTKNITTAKAAYKAKNLEETHFALQQAMQEIDMIIGKEVLKLLPTKMESLAVNANDDNVSANVGFVGSTIRRSYGKVEKQAELTIISNSPMVAMLNTLLNTPMMGGMMNDGNSKTIKVQGYKARMERKNGNEEGKYNYELQVPLGSALITFTVDDTNEKEMLAMANTIPMPQIAKLIQ